MGLWVLLPLGILTLLPVSVWSHLGTGLVMGQPPPIQAGPTESMKFNETELSRVLREKAKKQKRHI